MRLSARDHERSQEMDSAKIVSGLLAKDLLLPGGHQGRARTSARTSLSLVQGRLLIQAYCLVCSGPRAKKEAHGYMVTWLHGYMVTWLHAHARVSKIRPHRKSIDMISISRRADGPAMLVAEKENLQSAFRLRMLSIRDKELDFFMQNMQNVAKLAALLAGLGQSGLIYTKYIDMNICDPDEVLCAEFTYPLAVTLTMCLALFSMWGCMLVTMLAPGLALRGPQGSMDVCVDMVCCPLDAHGPESSAALRWFRPSFALCTQVAEEYQYALLTFSCALVMLLCSTVLWSWTQRSPATAVSLTLLSLSFLGIITATSKVVARRFGIERSQLVTGRFNFGSPGVDEKGGSTRWDRAPPRQPRDGYRRLDEEDEEEGAHMPRRGAATVGRTEALARRNSARTLTRAWQRKLAACGPTHPATPTHSKKERAAPKRAAPKRAAKRSAANQQRYAATPAAAPAGAPSRAPASADGRTPAAADSPTLALALALPPPSMDSASRSASLRTVLQYATAGGGGLIGLTAAEEQELLAIREAAGSTTAIGPPATTY